MGTLFIENRSRIERYYARSVLVRFGPVFIKTSTLYLIFSRIERNSTCGGLSPFRVRDDAEWGLSICSWCLSLPLADSDPRLPAD